MPLQKRTWQTTGADTETLPGHVALIASFAIGTRIAATWTFAFTIKGANISFALLSRLDSGFVSVD